MDISDPSTILTELQLQKSEDNEDGQVYYTILQSDADDESFALKTEEHEFLDSNNVFYLSFNNDELEETEATENQDDNTNSEETNVNMEFLEQVTLPDGTQAYMARDSPDDENLFEQNENTFELTDSSAMLLQNIDENLDDINNVKTSSDDEDSKLELEGTNLENSIILSQDADEDIDVSKYEQIQLEDGSVAMIEIGLYNTILEQSKKKELAVKDIKKETVGNSSRATFQCPQDDCNKAYTTMHHLRVHMRNHTGTRPYACRVEGCDKTFATGYSLKAHSRTHTGEKPYGCQTCIKRFKTSGDLQKHNRIHTGEKPFVCPIDGCGRSFTTSNIRKVHIRSHTGERPYQCPEPGCNKAFASATNYKNHIRIHSGEKPYVCSFEGCGKRFTEYSSLYKHQIVHSSAKPCRCEYCGRICRHQSTLIAHKRSVHNIIVTDNGTEIMVKMVDNEADEEVSGDLDELNTQILFVTQ